MKCHLSLLMLFLLVFSAFGQKKESVEIQYIDLQDTFLVKEIEKLIQEEVSREVDTASTDKMFTENFFKMGLGYVSLYIEGNLKGDTLARYYIAPSLMSIREDAADEAYAPFFTYINGRLILVYIPLLEDAVALKFSRKSKKMLRKRVSAFLEKPKDVMVYNLDGSVAFRDKNFRIDHLRFHGGKYIFIIKDKPPIVLKESEIPL